MSSVKEDATAAGAVEGPAPAAPQEPYRLRTETTYADGGAPAPTAPEVVVAYPLKLATTRAKPPVELQFSGVFEQNDCAGTQAPPLVNITQVHSLAEQLAEGDVYAYDIKLSFENRDDHWADMHLGLSLDATAVYMDEPVAEKRGVIVQNLTGQGYRLSADAPARIVVDCWYGNVGRDGMRYVVDVRLSFVEGGVPAQTPFLFEVPTGATRLFVRGVALDPAQGVQSHYRVFGPDDALLCECALGSSAEASAFELTRPGAYVVLVDHTANGFVSLALDAPPVGDLRALAAEWVGYPIVQSDGTAMLDAEKTIDLPSVPLNIFAFADTQPGAAPTAVGAVANLKIVVANARGEPMRMTFPGYAAMRTSLPGLPPETWVPIPIEGWEFTLDHHAFDKGQHKVTVHADVLRGVVSVFARHYVR